jgi:hypothetical protein
MGSQTRDHNDRGDEKSGDARQNDIKALRADAWCVVWVKIRHLRLPWLSQTLTRAAFRGSRINCD